MAEEWKDLWATGQRGVAIVQAKDSKSVSEITVGMERKERTPENAGKQNKQSFFLFQSLGTQQGRERDGEK